MLIEITEWDLMRISVILRIKLGHLKEIQIVWDQFQKLYKQNECQFLFEDNLFKIITGALIDHVKSLISGCPKNP